MGVCVCVFCLSSHSDLGGFIESVDPVDKVLLIIGLQEELPHPSIDDLQVTKKEHWEQKKKWKYILLSQSGYNTPSELQTNTHTKTYWSVFSALSCISVRTHPPPQISLEVKNNWAKGLSHTHPAAFSLHGDDDPARLSCLRLPPPTHV